MGNYPPGAANDPRAPWNEPDNREETFAVHVFYGLERTADVATDKYDDTEMDDPLGDYERQYLTPTRIFDFAFQAAALALSTHDYRLRSKAGLRLVLDSCGEWEATHSEAEQEKQH